MTRLSRVIPALVLTLAAAPLAAQDPASAAAAAECSVDLFQPAPIAQASLTIQKAAGAATPADAQKALKDAARFLGDRRNTANPLGVSYLTGQLYVLWLFQDGTPDVVTRSAIGAAGVPTETIDLVASADSLFAAVEGQAPTCAEDIQQWRRAKPWNERITKAYRMLDENNLDSASYYAQRAMTLDKSSPFVWNALAQVAERKGDKAEAVKLLRTAVEKAAGDTSLAQTRRQMQYQLASTAQEIAMSGSGDRNALLNEAVNTYAAIVREAPTSDEAPYALSAVGEVLAFTEDTAKVREILAPIVANPAPFSDLTLSLAGAMATRATQPDNAAALYKAALAKNPNMRDATYFLATIYYDKKDAESMMPVVDRLLEMDPSNPDNFLLKAYVYQLMAANEKDPKKKAALNAEVTAWGAKEGQMPHKLAITQFARLQEGAILSGTIENRGRAEKSYTLDVEFLDVAGTVLETGSVKVGPVKAAATEKFEVKATKKGVAAYRYKAIQ